MELTEQINYSKSIKKSKISNLVYHCTYYLILVILLVSGIIKIIDPLPLLETLKLIPFLPNEIHLISVTILPIVEIGLGLLMLLKVTPKVTLLMVSVLFLIFLTFSIYGTISGVEGDCGCFGDVVKSEFGTSMIIRNFVFLITSIWVLYSNYKRNLMK